MPDPETMAVSSSLESRTHAGATGAVGRPAADVADRRPLSGAGGGRAGHPQADGRDAEGRLTEPGKADEAEGRTKRRGWWNRLV